jgi:hypothetical protein
MSTVDVCDSSGGRGGGGVELLSTVNISMNLTSYSKWLVTRMRGAGALFRWKTREGEYLGKSLKFAFRH